MEWDDQNISKFKSITKAFIVEFNKVMHKIQTSQELRYESPLYTYLSIDEVNEKQTTILEKIVYSINFEIIREYFQKKFPSKDLPEYYEFLKEMKVFDESSSLNPHSTIFGAIISSYLQEIYEHDEGELPDTKSLDEELFEEIFSTYLERINENEIEVLIIYPIFGLNITGTNFKYDLIGSHKEFVIPSTIDKEQLSKFLRFSSYYNSNAFSRLTWISNCSAWIIGTAKIKLPELNFNREPNNDALTTDLGLFSPSFLEEALYLLGFTAAKVKVFTEATRYNLHTLNIQPHNHGVSYSTGSPNYDWMNTSLQFSHKSGELKIDDLNTHFLKLYPALRKKTFADQIMTIILDRFYRAHVLKNNYDKILECVIALETLLIDNTSELTFQLRLKVSWLLAEKIEDRIFIFNLMKYIYDLRSKIVHDGGLNMEKSLNKLGGLSNAAIITIQTLRLVILRILQLSNNEFNFLARVTLLEKLYKKILGQSVTLGNNPYYEESFNNILLDIKSKIPDEFKTELTKLV